MKDVYDYMRNKEYVKVTYANGLFDKYDFQSMIGQTRFIEFGFNKEIINVEVLERN